MIFHIAVCDDKKNVRDCLRAFLESYAHRKKLQFELTLFASGEELLGHYPEKMDLIFLDITMDGMDGMDTARKIRQFDSEVCIIFITIMYQRAIDGYGVRAFGFIKKPINPMELRHELACALKHIEKRHEEETYITVREGARVFRFPVSQIAYCEVQNHHVYMQVDGERREFRLSMKSLEDMLLPLGFLRSHASYLVNIRCIVRLEPAEILLSDGSRVPISQRRRKEFLNEFYQCLESKI